MNPTTADLAIVEKLLPRLLLLSFVIFKYVISVVQICALMLLLSQLLLLLLPRLLLPRLPRRLLLPLLLRPLPPVTLTRPPAICPLVVSACSFEFCSERVAVAITLDDIWVR